MNILEILIILFLVFPFIKRIIDEVRGQGQKLPEGQQKQKDSDSEQSNPWESPNDFSWGDPQEKPKEKSRSGGTWDDALQELEDLFAGQPTQRRKEQRESPRKPEPAPQTRSHTTSTEDDTLNQKQQAAIGNVDASSDLMDTENPIYKSLDEAPEVITIESKARDYSADLHEPGALRHAFILKEILDTPSSLRRVRRTPNGY